jgi:chromosome segregation ATPase
VLFYQLLPSPSEEKPIPPVVVLASSHSSEKDKGERLYLLNSLQYSPPQKSIAEVTISIKNQGEEAYKPKEYGKSIVITRRFTKEGSSSWKIKSKDGRVISTKKDELSAICDHMNIQVDNPMNVLTQGMSTV